VCLPAVHWRELVIHWWGILFWVSGRSVVKGAVSKSAFKCHTRFLIMLSCLCVLMLFKYVVSTNVMWWTKVWCIKKSMLSILTVILFNCLPLQMWTRHTTALCLYSIPRKYQRYTTTVLRLLAMSAQTYLCTGLLLVTNSSGSYHGYCHKLDMSVTKSDLECLCQHNYLHQGGYVFVIVCLFVC